MIDRDMVKQKILAIQKDLKELESYRTITPDDLIKDYRTHKAVERMIEVIINEAIDINQPISFIWAKESSPLIFVKAFYF